MSFNQIDLHIAEIRKEVEAMDSPTEVIQISENVELLPPSIYVEKFHTSYALMSHNYKDVTESDYLKFNRKICSRGFSDKFLSRFFMYINRNVYDILLYPKQYLHFIDPFGDPTRALLVFRCPVGHFMMSFDSGGFNIHVLHLDGSTLINSRETDGLLHPYVEEVLNVPHHVKMVRNGSDTPFEDFGLFNPSVEDKFSIIQREFKTNDKINSITNYESTFENGVFNIILTIDESLNRLVDFSFMSLMVNLEQDYDHIVKIYKHKSSSPILSDEVSIILDDTDLPYHEVELNVDQELLIKRIILSVSNEYIINNGNSMLFPLNINGHSLRFEISSQGVTATTTNPDTLANDFETLNKVKFAGLMLISLGQGEYVGVARKSNENSFGLAGGKMEFSDESILKTISREVFEETGIRLSKRLISDGDIHSKYYNGLYCVTSVMDLERHREEAILIIDNFNKTRTNEALVKLVTKDEMIAGEFGDFNVELFGLMDKNNELEKCQDS